MAGIDEVRFEYHQDRDYRIVPVTGVVGHAAPYGFGVFASFFCEYVDLPSHSIRASVDEDHYGPEVTHGPKPGVLQRKIWTSFVLTPEKARTIGQWMIDQAEKAEAIEKKTQELKQKLESAGGGDGGTV